MADATPATTNIEGKKYQRGERLCASNETAKKVDPYSVEVARNYLSKKYPNSVIEVLGHNNPGFDILVRNGQDVNFVEIKGTQRLSPQCFMSDGELKLSVANAEKYMLLVVYEIDLEKSQHKIFTRTWEINANYFHLTPIQWSIVARE